MRHTSNDFSGPRIGAFSSYMHLTQPGAQVPHTPTQHGSTPNITPIQSTHLPQPQPNDTGSLFDDDTAPWLFENDFSIESGFDFDASEPVEPTSVTNQNDGASIDRTLTPGRPAVLTAMDSLREKEKGSAHRLMKQCETLEDAMVLIGSASNSGAKGAPRISSMVGLFRRLRDAKMHDESKVFACMCLANFRMERAGRMTVGYYEELAAALPATLPPELHAYRDLLVERATAAIRMIRGDGFDPTSHDGRRVHQALDTIQQRLGQYKAQAISATQAFSVKRFTELAGQKYQQFVAGKLKRTHKASVTNAVPTSINEYGAGVDDGTSSGTNKRARTLPTGQLPTPWVETGINIPFLTGEPQPPRAIARTEPQIMQPGVRPMPGNPVQQLGRQPPAPTWAPAAYMGQMLDMAHGGMLKLTPQAYAAIGAFAACTNRQDLSYAIKHSITLHGLLETLALMRQLNADAAAEFAFAVTLDYMPNPQALPGELVPMLADALVHVKRLPDDVTFTFDLAIQASGLPQVLSEAMLKLFDALLRRSSH